jgi:hypothetical protein
MGRRAFGRGLDQRRALVYGARFSHLWSLAGDSDRDDVNQSLIQPYINHNLSDGC